MLLNCIHSRSKMVWSSHILLLKPLCIQDPLLLAFCYRDVQKRSRSGIPQTYKTWSLWDSKSHSSLTQTCSRPDRKTWAISYCPASLLQAFYCHSSASASCQLAANLTEQLNARVFPQSLEPFLSHSRSAFFAAVCCLRISNIHWNSTNARALAQTRTPWILWSTTRCCLWLWMWLLHRISSPQIYARRL